MKNILIRAAEVKAATQAVPKALLAHLQHDTANSGNRKLQSHRNPPSPIRYGPARHETFDPPEEVARKIGNFRSIYK